MVQHPDTITVLISRPKAVLFVNPADSDVLRYQYDLFIHNNSDLFGLSEKAFYFVKHIMERRTHATR